MIHDLMVYFLSMMPLFFRPPLCISISSLFDFNSASATSICQSRVTTYIGAYWAVGLFDLWSVVS
jgi:hypothetical protein